MSWWPVKYKSQSDVELMELICRNDELAFRELYRRYSKPVQRYFYRMLYQDRELASDATQELFIKVFEKGKLFDPKQNFQTWLFSVAHNHCKNVYRTKSRRIQEVALEYDNFSIQTEVSYEGDFPTTQFKSALKTALQTLPENQKNLFVLRFLESFSIKEIAEITGTAEGTIKSGLHRVLKKLAKELESFHPKNLDL